jgi:hypothetical protein
MRSSQSDSRPTPNRRFQFHKRSQFFISAHVSARTLGDQVHNEFQPKLQSAFLRLSAMISITSSVAVWIAQSIVQRKKTAC